GATRPAADAPLLKVLVTASVMAALLKCLLSWRMLQSEVAAVEAALGQSLEAGRQRLSWLVSRDTAQLSASEVRESAIESLAENLNDSVVAPIFWFALLGLPGAAVYRFANTADAMWGYPGVYRGHDWQWAGKWAARADDVLSWVPARLTAVLLAVGSRGRAMASLRSEAGKTPSPNSGWPMAAMALALGVRLCKPGVYTLHPGGRAPQPADTASAQQRAGAALRLLVWMVLLTLLVAMLAGWLLAGLACTGACTVKGAP
ncbi:MAG: cobalamin biosynthesis protein CobD, partial [Comamonadaceae bacterium]